MCQRIHDESVPVTPPGMVERQHEIFAGQRVTIAAKGLIMNRDHRTIKVRCQHHSGRTEEHTMEPGDILTDEEEVVYHILGISP